MIGADFGKRVPDGGPAFPAHENWRIDSGMTLRDYFAAKAMGMKFGNAGSHIGLEEMAAKCYAMADAMLAAREVA